MSGFSARTILGVADLRSESSLLGFWFFGLSYATDSIIRDETLIKKNIWRFLSIVFDLERTNQLNLLPDKDLVDLCHPIEP